MSYKRCVIEVAIMDSGKIDGSEIEEVEELESGGWEISNVTSIVLLEPIKLLDDVCIGVHFYHMRKEEFP